MSDRPPDEAAAFAKALNPVHEDPTGQVTLYQTEDRYQSLLTECFGGRFLDYRRQWRETSERGDHGDFPLSLDLAINSGCQLNCVMCPLKSFAGGRQVRLMEKRLFQRLMAQAEEHRLPALTLGLGSEPLLNPAAAQWVGLAVKAGIMDIRLGTNGLLLNAENAKALMDNGLTRLEVSVDAARPETYRAVRGGDLEALERNIDQFLDLRVKAGLKMPLLRLSFLKLELNRDELEPFLNRWGSRVDMVSIQEPIWFPGSSLPRPKNPGRCLARQCSQPWQRLGITHDGRGWPCCSWHGDKLLSFSAEEMPLARIWTSQALDDLRNSLSRTEDLIPPPCRLCEC